jgi:hypothetical protein
MGIYSEQTDPNENVPTTKDEIIEKINRIIKEYGNFTVADVEAESSPILESKGKLSHLAEEFMEGNCIVFVYDPTSHSSDEIDKYDEFYEEFEENQLEYILELAEKWEEQNVEEDEETTPEDWTATELFDFLQTNHVISDEDDFEKWMHDRTDMISLVQDYIDNLNSEE